MLSLYMQVLYDTRVRVTFQQKAWCDERVMQEWVNLQWKPASEQDMMLVLDVHKAQKTPCILETLQAINTTPIYVPAGTTGLIQPLDVCFNGPFKAAIKQQADDHIHSNLDKYIQGTIPASERRILFTKWVGSAWEQISRNHDMVKRSFHKCGISVPIDGSKDTDINIKDLPDYSVGEMETTESDDEDPFASGEDDEEDPAGCHTK